MKTENKKSGCAIFILLLVTIFIMSMCYNINNKVNKKKYISKERKVEEPIIIENVNNHSLDSIRAFTEYNEDSLYFSPYYNRMSIYISVSNPIDSIHLYAIASYYHDKYINSRKRILIFYNLKGYKDCYATTHCEPNIVVNIMPVFK